MSEEHRLSCNASARQRFVLSSLTSDLPQAPERMFAAAWFRSSLSMFGRGVPVVIASVGTLIGTCSMPKNVRPSSAGMT